MSPLTPLHKPPLGKEDKILKKRIGYLRDIDRKRKWDLDAKYGAVCWYCGIAIPEIRQRTVDHVVPLSELVRQEDYPKEREVALACIPCNGAKGNRSVEEFHQWIRHIRSSSFSNYMGYETPTTLQRILLKASNTLTQLGVFTIIS